MVVSLRAQEPAALGCHLVCFGERYGLVLLGNDRYTLTQVLRRWGYLWQAGEPPWGMVQHLRDPGMHRKAVPWNAPYTWLGRPANSLNRRQFGEESVMQRQKTQAGDKSRQCLAQLIFPLGKN